MKHKIITGGGHSLTKELITKYGLEIIPYSFYVDQKNYFDGEINISDFLEKLKKIKSPEDFPKTAALSTGLIVESFKKFPQKDHNIFCVIMSKEMTSGTYLALEQAKKIAQRPEIKIIDTNQVTMGKDLIVVKIAEFATPEKTVDEITAFSKKIVASTNSILAMPNLKYLYYGGRIGKGKVLMGSLFNMVPLVGFMDEQGVINPLGKAVTVSKTNQKIVRLIEEDLAKKKGDKITCMIADANNQAASDDLKQKLSQKFGNVKIIDGIIGCTGICHMGPRSWGVGYCIE
jgi:DegV family protein with EDD domain